MSLYVVRLIAQGLLIVISHASMTSVKNFSKGPRPLITYVIRINKEIKINMNKEKMMYQK